MLPVNLDLVTWRSSWRAITNRSSDHEPVERSRTGRAITNRSYREL
jgi:hypothetical protein